MTGALSGAYHLHHSFLSIRQSKSTAGANIDSEPVSILHPEAAKAESLIRNAWADAKLVAD